MNLDAHQHFWKFDAGQYPWIDDSKHVLARDYLPNDLQPLLAEANLGGSIAVQARQTLEESRWLLSLADQFPLIKGVVGWVDLQSDQLEEQLAELSRHPRLVGVRHVVQDEPDDQFMLRPNFLRGLGELKQYNLTYDLLIHPKQLPAAMAVAKKFPEQPFVLDHLAKPIIKSGRLSPWDQQIRELARSGNVWGKVSGLVTEAKWGRWHQQDFRPYLDVVFEAFGEERLMFGSDWPVCLLAASYEQVCGIVADYLTQFPAGTRRKVLGENAAKFYGVSAPQHA